MRLHYSTFQKHEGHLHRIGLHQACVHSQNKAFPKEPREWEREGVGYDKTPKPLGFSSTYASKYSVPQITHRDQPHSHFYLKKKKNVRIAAEFLNQAPTKKTIINNKKPKPAAF